MSMHPVEHILYFSGALLHWVLLSHPLHVIFHVQATGLSPAMGHVGYHKWMKKDGTERLDRTTLLPLPPPPLFRMQLRGRRDGAAR